MTSSDGGFATAQFLGLMIIAIMLLTTFVNVMMIEYMRSASLSSLRDAARGGTQVVDLERAFGNPDQEARAIEECERRLQESLKDLINADATGSEATCAVEPNNSGGQDRYAIRATLDLNESVALVPWAKPFSSRLNNLEATYVQRQVANDD